MILPPLLEPRKVLFGSVHVCVGWEGRYAVAFDAEVEAKSAGGIVGA